LIAGAEEGKEILVEEEAEDEQDHGPAASDVHTPELKPTTAGSAPVFYIATVAARCPSHGSDKAHQRPTFPT